MPIYEYECPSCGHDFEKIQKFSDPPVKRCPECGSSVRKKLSVSAFMLKGGGWYADGYSGKAEKARKKEAGGTGDGASKGDTKASKKADAKASAKSSS
jgi:putative FmdB family regulatory protein